ncbi:MAG TPA: FliH/SctL family protein [Pseudacidobacterium sp.]|nr:FliH/SctL family protein [Pseudacidobacterium sp.]
MLQTAEPKIRRMEYRIARAEGSVFEPKQLFAIDKPEGMPMPDESSKEELQRQARRIQELEQQIADQMRQHAEQIESARQEAFESGRNAESGLRVSALNKIADALGSSLNDFRNARDSYLSLVEREVVRLALSIAARILHREAQMDPLLLSGAVRVALGQLSETTEVRLRVPAEEYELWSEMVHLMPNLPLRPHLVSDDSLHAGECSLETSLGSVELGVKSQLAEIERGFFDILERKEPLRRNEATQTSDPPKS